MFVHNKVQILLNELADKKDHSGNDTYIFMVRAYSQLTWFLNMEII
jgi:predicted aminopeptidase